MARQAGKCTVARVWRVLTWNLFHGRSLPPAGRDLREEFARALAGWEWDLALLQEVPPWWPESLAIAADAHERHVLTSRNSLLVLRRALATRWPDLIKSNGGGCNAILARGEIVEERRRRLCVLPERRWLQAVKLASGVWVANLHATAHDPPAAERDVQLAAQTALAWAGGAPLVLGGDLNLRAPQLPELVYVAGHDVDHVFASGMRPTEQGRVLERGPLSDHAPVLGSVT